MEKEYKIIRKLGEGGFGIVYLVEKNNKQYALKQCKNKLKNEEIEQYKKIINIISKINNEYLIKYYDAFIENDTFNILMEYGGDIDLKKYIKNYKDENVLIKEDIIKDIILQICKGLKEIHNNKIIHRDLTPENIFIDKNNNIKIGDFGVSKILTTLNKYTQSQIGKIKYLAPEILKGLKYNNKVDIYALGCIIYELFTTNEYFIDKKIDEKECKIDTEVYNKKYQELIDILLKKDYHERPNIEEVIDLIENIENINTIIAEINIKETDINKDISIINSYEEDNRGYDWMMTKEEIDKYGNEKEIKDNCKIKINNNYIDFNYYYKFKEKGKYIIKYIFTNNINKTNYMFFGCSSLTNINLSNLNTQNVNDMSHMFDGCILLTNIDLSNFNTQNVNDMSFMFCGCSSLTNIDLSKFNTKSVKDMMGMFDACKSLAIINLSMFNTQNVSNMRWMFFGCGALTNINLSNFNTENVEDMREMFKGCKSLSNINLFKFNTQNVKKMDHMFDGCKSLVNIDLSNFNTQNVEYMHDMFYECYSLKSLDLSNFNTQNVKNMDRMFDGCNSLTNINSNDKNILKQFKQVHQNCYIF